VRTILGSTPLRGEQHGGGHCPGILHPFHQIVLGAFGQGTEGEIPIMSPGHHHHRDIGSNAQDGAQRVQALGIGQREVGDCDVQRVRQQWNSFGEGGRDLDDRSREFVRQNVEQQFGIRARVLDEQDPQRTLAVGRKKLP